MSGRLNHQFGSLAASQFLDALNPLQSLRNLRFGPLHTDCATLDFLQQPARIERVEPYTTLITGRSSAVIRAMIRSLARW